MGESECRPGPGSGVAWGAGARGARALGPRRRPGGAGPGGAPDPRGGGRQRGCSWTARLSRAGVEPTWRTALREPEGRRRPRLGVQAPGSPRGQRPGGWVLGAQCCRLGPGWALCPATPAAGSAQGVCPGPRSGPAVGDLPLSPMRREDPGVQAVRVWAWGRGEDRRSWASGSSGLSCSFRPGCPDNSGDTRAGRGHPFPCPPSAGQAECVQTPSAPTEKGTSNMVVKGSPESH